MSLSLARSKILEAMLLNEKSANVQDIAKEVGSNFKAVNMHLIGLAKAGYATSPAKGQYVITGKGKEALGIPATTKEAAQQILAQTSPDKVFYFYAEIDKPLNQSAKGLKEFTEKLETLDSASLEFHMRRADFENWFTSLGDKELAKKMALLQAKGLAGEPLRAKLKEILDNRCEVLYALVQL
jgi:predicted transcriptional regulator